MRIAVISNGAQSLLNFRAPLMIEMVRRGHEVLAFAPDHDASSRQELSAMHVRPIDFTMSRAGTSPARELSSVLELRRLLRQHQPDVCFAYFLKPVIYGTFAAWLSGVERRFGLIEGLGFSFTDEPNMARKRKLLQTVITLLAKLSLVWIHRLMFLNQDDLDEFVTRGIISPKKAALSGAIGVDLKAWPPYPLPEAPMTFILIARLLRDKGIAEYVEAARLVRATHPEARFLLLGGLDDNPTAFTHAEVKAWVAEGILKWPGHVPVRPWLAQAHVFVLPSYREGVPLSTQEAMAVGRPIITTDVPGCRETVVDGRNGYLVPPRDPLALASAMERFLGNPDRVAHMGEESRRMAEERFDSRQQIMKLLKLMELG